MITVRITSSVVVTVVQFSLMKRLTFKQKRPSEVISLVLKLCHAIFSPQMTDHPLCLQQWHWPRVRMQLGDLQPFAWKRYGKPPQKNKENPSFFHFPNCRKKTSGNYPRRTRSRRSVSQIESIFRHWNIYWKLISFRGPKFDLVATAKLRIEHVNINVSTHDLVLENIG